VTTGCLALSAVVATLAGARLLWGYLEKPLRDRPPERLRQQRNAYDTKEAPPARRNHSEPIFEGRLEYEVDTGTLVLDRLGLRGARGALPDLARLDGVARGALRELDGLRVRVVLREGQLTLLWMGPRDRRPRIEEHASALRRAFRGRLEPWERIESLLQSQDVEDRRWLFEAAVRVDDPLRERTLRELMADPDPRLALKVLQGHGSAEDWLRVALMPGRAPELRREAVSWLQELPEVERCSAVSRLLAFPEVHESLPRLIGWADGEEAETAWLALLERSEDPEVLQVVVSRLAEIGTRCSLAPLHQRRERLGPLQLRLKAELTRALEVLQARVGGASGALSLADPAAEAGALSVAAEEGRLSEARQEPDLTRTPGSR
jgi:hypothetical protein